MAVAAQGPPEATPDERHEPEAPGPQVARQRDAREVEDVVDLDAPVARKDVS